jgi:hypothetical protein
MISFASRGTALRTGDVIGSGTVGTGCILELSRVHGARSYPWLAPGDVVRISVDRLGAVQSNLVGAWVLESYLSTRPDGTDIQYPLGPEAAGIIMYTPDGFMSAQIMRADRPRFAGEDVQNAQEEEFASVAGYLAYSGPYTVAEDGSEVRHQVAVSLHPNWLGSVQARVLSLDGDRLELSAAGPMRVNGEQRTAQLMWRRAAISPMSAGDSDS